MDMNNFNPRIIKPSRLQSKSPELKRSRCIKNHLKNVETSLVFDLNILSKMNKVVCGEISINQSGLVGLVTILNKLPALYLTPGFAIAEISHEYLHTVTNSYEVFLDKYCPSYDDAPNATHDYKNLNSKPTEFLKLDKSEKYLNSISYLGILRIQIEERINQGSQYDKYNEYLSYMINIADMVGVVESEVAKYVFSDYSQIKDQKFKIFSSKIKKNFKKTSSDPKEALKKCLNAARDIMYYRTTADRSNEYIDGKLQDTWLITADDGLCNLTDSIHFLPNMDNSDSKYVSYIRCKEQKKSDYWNYCDDITIKNLNYRQLVRAITDEPEKLEDKDLDKILGYIEDSEDELSKIILNGENNQ